MTGSGRADDPLARSALRRARRAAAARVLQGLALDWSAIDAIPAWLAEGDADAHERLCARAGGWWLAAALRACIDGKRLARVCELLGEPALAELRESASVRRAEALNEVPRPLLPPAERTPEHLLACGRALLGWSLQPDLRAPVLAHLGWTVDEGHYAAFDAHASWAAQALLLAEQPAPEPEALAHSEADADTETDTDIDAEMESGAETADDAESNLNAEA